MAGIERIGGSPLLQAANSPPAAAAGRAAQAPVPEATAAGPTASARGQATPTTEVQLSAGKVQQMLAKAAPNLTFSVDRDSGRTVIKIIDPETREVLRQIPAEEILRMDKNLDQMIARLKGLLIDRQG